MLAVSHRKHDLQKPVFEAGLFRCYFSSVTKLCIDSRCII